VDDAIRSTVTLAIRMAKANNSLALHKSLQSWNSDCTDALINILVGLILEDPLYSEFQVSKLTAIKLLTKILSTNSTRLSIYTMLMRSFDGTEHVN